METLTIIGIILAAILLPLAVFMAWKVWQKKKAEEVLWKEEQARKVKVTDSNLGIKDTIEEINIEPFETFKIHDLANMFPFNITPALIESKIQHAIALRQAFLNKLTPQFAVMAVTVMVGGAIAAIILWKFIGADQAKEITVNLPGGLQTIATNFTA